VASRGGLGKGLGALIPAGAGDSTVGLVDLAVADIRPNPYQPRAVFDEETLASLAESIREVGVLQPVLVRRVDDGYELVAGERRWRAARRVGLQTVPALVRDTDDASALEHALVENIHRSDLNILEEAAAFQQLIGDFGLTHEEVAARVGRSRAAVSNTIRLLALPPAVQRLVREGKVSMGHARALLATPDRSFQERLARQVASKDLTVRGVEEAIRAHQEGTDEGTSAVTSPVQPLRPPGLLELEGLLGDHLDTRVSVTMSAQRGKVLIEFSDLEDLERIYKRIIGRGD